MPLATELVGRMDTEDIAAVQQTLAQTWGLDFGRVRSLISHLNSWQTQDQLVDRHALSHRGIGQILRALEPWLEVDGDRYRLAPQYRDAFSPHFSRQPTPTEASSTQPTLPSLEHILTQRPAPNLDLDHVAATPETLLKRANFIVETYDLTGAEILCLGDHDLTSLALASVHSEVAISVVDVDERLLLFIDQTARQFGWNIKTYFADLRLELPSSLKARFDLIFTDPPYSPTGVKLFLQRGISALKDHPFTRILLAYGFGEQHPGLGYKVQSVLHELRLVSEAILPQFNRYNGARAIGAQSALYALRPTRRSGPAAERIANTATIYTHGKSAEESTPLSTLAGVRDLTQSWQGGETILVQESQQQETWPQVKKMDLAAYLALSRQEGPPRVRNLAIQLYPHFDPYLIRILLTAQAESLLIGIHRSGRKTLADNNSLYQLITCRYRLIEQKTQQDLTWILFEQRPMSSAKNPLSLLHYIGDHSQARLGNAWREGLISQSKHQGINLTKNQARKLIRQGGLGSRYGNHFLNELPLHLLDELVAEIETTMQF